MSEKFTTPEAANDNESPAELMERAKKEVPAEIVRQLGSEITEADALEAERVIAALMEKYAATPGNGMRKHYEIAAELRTWVRAAAVLKKIEKDFNIPALIANDNHPQQRAVA